jgi:hypothetical protein
MEDRVPDARELADLQAKAAAASPNEQPYIYAELVHSMTEIATAQFQAGDQEHASASLKAAQSYAGKIQMSLLRDAKKLKNAEILRTHDRRVSRRSPDSRSDDPAAESGAVGYDHPDFSSLKTALAIGSFLKRAKLPKTPALQSLQLHPFSLSDPHPFNRPATRRSQYSSGHNRTPCKPRPRRTPSSLIFCHCHPSPPFVL